MSQVLTVVGQIATVPRFHRSANGIEFCSFRLASTDRRFDREGNKWVDADTNWYTVHLFRRLARHARESFAKGERVMVKGRLRIRQWENDEKSGTSVEIDADSAGHDLLWGTSTFSRRPLEGASVEQQEGDGDASGGASIGEPIVHREGPVADASDLPAPAAATERSSVAELSPAVDRELAAAPF